MYLRALRHVSQKPASEDKSQLERELRMLKGESAESMARFMDRLHKAESEHRRGRVKAAGNGTAASEPGEAAGEDEPGERCLSLVEEMLREKPWLK